MGTTRRGFLATTATAAAIAGFPAILRAEPMVELTVIHGSPEKHVISAGGVKPWMDRVTELSKGAVSFKYYPAGQLAELRALLSSLASGVGDGAPIPVGYSSDKMPLAGVSMLPGLGRTAKEMIDAYSKAMKDGAIVKEFEANGVVPIWNMAFPPYQIVSMSEALRTVDDFNGKVIRSAGGSMNLVVQALGASPAEIPVNDMYLALERGTVNATISALNSLKPYNVHELMKAVSTNGSFGTFTNVFCIRQAKWDEIPAELQELMKQAGADTEKSVAKYLDDETAVLTTEFAGLDVDMYEFEPDALQEINERLVTVQDDWVTRLEGRGLPAKEVLEAYRSLVNA